MTLSTLGGDFVAPPKPKNQAIAMIFGIGGHGKTTVALEAPGPIAYIDIDRRGSHAIAAALQKDPKKKIFYAGIDQPANISKLDDKGARAAGQKAVDKLRRNHELALQQSLKGNVRTVIWDTGTELGELFALSKQGRIDLKNDDYGKAKGIIKVEYSKLIKMSRESNANLIILARAKTEPWVNGAPTGKYTYQGLDTMEYDSDWAGHIRIKREKGVGGKRKFEHEFEVTKDGITFTQMGAVYKEDDWSDLGSLFVYASTMLFPDSSPDDWT